MSPRTPREPRGCPTPGACSCAAPLALEAGLRVQLSEDSQRHLDRALTAETQILGLRAALTHAEAERDTAADESNRQSHAANIYLRRAELAETHAEALAGALERLAHTRSHVCGSACSLGQGRVWSVPAPR